MGALATAILFFGLGAAAPHPSSPCAHIEITAKETIKLSPMETKLVCGDPKNPPWATIPRNQASFLMRSFLQTRGYYHPVFTARDQVLVVDAGEPTIITSLTAGGAPAEFDISRYWRAKGQRLTPKLLTSLETWTASELKAEGYACPLVTSHGNPDTGDVTVSVASGPRLTVAEVDAERVPGLLDGVLRRDDAFSIGDTYDGNLVTLTTRRAVAKELLLSTHFTEQCGPLGVQLKQSAMPGPPRVVRVGFGFNTERLFLVQASLRNSRLGPTGSVLDVNAMASRPEQQLTLSAQWYYLPHASRHFLEPSIELKREDEAAYETRSAKVRFAPAVNWDGFGVNAAGSLGPAFEMVSTVRGPGRGFSRLTTLDGEASVVSHDYELYQGAPRSGFRLSLASALSRKAWKSVLDAQTFSVSGQELWNLAALEPPLLVVGVRGGYATTITGHSSEEFEALPPTWRHYLGGSSSVRGFGRQTLPSADGALTAAYAGMELRLASPLPFNLQPLVFADAGKTGPRPMALASPVYWSPGLGLRWASPVGPIRVQAAHGLVVASDAERARVPSKWAYYFSFGEEF